MGKCISLLGELIPEYKTLSELANTTDLEAIENLQRLVHTQGFGNYFTVFPKINGYNLCEILFDPK